MQFWGSYAGLLSRNCVLSSEHQILGSKRMVSWLVLVVENSDLVQAPEDAKEYAGLFLPLSSPGS